MHMYKLRKNLMRFAARYFFVIKNPEPRTAWDSLKLIMMEVQCCSMQVWFKQHGCNVHIEEAANSQFPNFIATHEEHGTIVIRRMDYYREYQKLL